MGTGAVTPSLVGHRAADHTPSRRSQFPSAGHLRVAGRTRVSSDLLSSLPPHHADILPFSGVPPQKLLPLARCEGNPLGEARTPKSQETCSQADPPGDEAPCTSSLTSDADGGRLRSGRSAPAFARAGLCGQGRRLLGARGGRDAPRRRASSYDPQITGRKRRLRFLKPCFSLRKTTSHAKAIFFRKKLEKASLQLQMVWF